MLILRGSKYRPRRFTVYSYSDATWASWCLKLLANTLFAQPFVKTNINENIKARVTVPSWGESTGDRWIRDGFSSPGASNQENVSISWRHDTFGWSISHQICISFLFVQSWYHYMFFRFPIDPCVSNHIFVTVADNFRVCYCITICNNASTLPFYAQHYFDVIMGAMASQITSVSIVYSTLCSGVNQRKYEASRHWPLWGEFTGDWWIPLAMGPWHGKCLRFDGVITKSGDVVYIPIYVGNWLGLYWQSLACELGLCAWAVDSQ